MYGKETPQLPETVSEKTLKYDQKLYPALQCSFDSGSRQFLEQLFLKNSSPITRSLPCTKIILANERHQWWCSGFENQSRFYWKLFFLPTVFPEMQSATWGIKHPELTRYLENKSGVTRVIVQGSCRLLVKGWVNKAVTRNAFSLLPGRAFWGFIECWSCKMTFLKYACSRWLKISSFSRTWLVTLFFSAGTCEFW